MCPDNRNEFLNRAATRSYSWPAAAAINCRNKRPSKLDSEWAVVIDSGDTSCATRQNQHRAPSSHFADYGLRVCRPRAPAGLCYGKVLRRLVIDG